MRVFVTGVTGFVGSHLVAALREQGHEVTGLARNRRKVESVFAGSPPRIVEGTLKDADALKRGCEAAEAIIHVAGLTAARNQQEFLEINGHATRSLVRIAAATTSTLQHFVYVSSLAAAGPSRRGEPISEGRAAQPVSNYGWSKLAGEEATRQSDLPWTVVRPAAVYGPRDRELYRVFKLARLGVTPVFAGGNQEISLVYVTDLVRALVACLQPGAVGRTYFAAHPEVVSQREFCTQVYRAVRERTGQPLLPSVPGWLARAILTVTGAAASVTRQATLLSRDKANEFLAEAWTCRPDALIEDTGWEPETGLDLGLPRTVGWYREHQWL